MTPQSANIHRTAFARKQTGRVHQTEFSPRTPSVKTLRVFGPPASVATALLAHDERLTCKFLAGRAQDTFRNILDRDECSTGIPGTIQNDQVTDGFHNTICPIANDERVVTMILDKPGHAFGFSEHRPAVRQDHGQRACDGS